DVDGIHIDDYFYPSVDKKIDASEYGKYIEGGGGLTLEDWRRQRVSDFVKALYSAVKTENPGALFGISPAGNVRLNMEEYYADVKLWVQEEGYIDYIIPQLYYGFKHTVLPFGQALDEWNEMVTNDDIKVYYGLAAYKTGRPDKYKELDEEAKNEWLESSDILARQLTAVRNSRRCDGFSVFEYTGFFADDPDDISRKEAENFLKAMGG
ncbi:MAG: family 10 glycosylhydrolase, partial [Oscillospiraceae bacterium]|nr:family 10 glycosylhydrolase [Oscillospiraceae bacterium]